jgi:SAM-dependent methyltransferase
MFDSDTAYDNFMGRFSVPLAPLFADFAGIAAGTRVLDVGAGTGALTGELARRGAKVAAADPSPQFADTLRRRFPGVDVQRAPAEDLPWGDESFDAALAQLVVAFMRDAPAGIAEMRRIVRSGGTLAVCMWDRDDMELLGAVNRTQRVLDPTKPPPEHVRNYRTAEELEGLLGQGAVLDRLTVESEYTGFDEFWAALAAGVGPAGEWLAELSEEQRGFAREEIYRQIGEPDGPFTLSGSAWAVRATRA